MNYLFFGTPDFSARFLNVLLEHGMIPKAVVCNPDRPVGRKKTIMPPAVKTVVESWDAKHGADIRILQPEKLDAAFVETLKSFNADLFLVFAYNKIFRKNVLEIPARGVIGVHPSFLPEYRGPSPFQTALLNGDAETGVTLYLLDEGIDSGPIIAASAPIKIEDGDSARALATKLADAGAEFAINILPRFLNGTMTPQPQDEARATFTKKFKTEDGFVDPADLTAAERGDDTKLAASIANKIRAFTPEPSAWTIRDGKRVKLLAAEVQNGVLRLTQTQEEGQTMRQIPEDSYQK